MIIPFTIYKPASTDAGGSSGKQIFMIEYEFTCQSVSADISKSPSATLAVA